jgi:hypothetical protein
MSDWDSDKEAAYQRWQKWNISTDDFIPLENQLSLIKDVSTGLVWDVAEFLDRQMEEEGLA